MKNFLCLALIAIGFLCGSNTYAKKEVTRQLGGACGEDSNMIANCAPGLNCQNGYCQMKSFLSSATVGCKQAMRDLGDTSKYVAVHDGFCYIDNVCKGLYNKVMRASNVTQKVISDNGSVDPKSFEALSDEDRQTFQEAATACQQCGKCVIGRQFLGRGGY